MTTSRETRSSSRRADVLPRLTAGPSIATPPLPGASVLRRHPAPHWRHVQASAEVDPVVWPVA